MSTPFDDDLDLTVDLDLTGVNKKHIEDLGKPIAPGKYHIKLTKIDRKNDGNKPYLILHLHLLSGTSPGQNNRTLQERLYLNVDNEQVRDRYCKFASTFDVIKEEDFGKSGVKHDWQGAIGRQAVVQIRNREYTDKDGGKGILAEVGFSSIWKVSDPFVASVPKSRAALEEIGLAHLADINPQPVGEAAKASDPFGQMG